MGGAALNQANLVANLGPYTNTGAGGFALTDGRTLNVTGAVDAGTGDLALTTTSGNLAVGADLTAGTTVTLTSSQAITQTAPISAQNLVALTELDAGAPITLTNPANAVSGNVTLSALNSAGTAPASGAISFTDSTGTGFTVAAQPGNGLNGQEIGVNTNASVTLEEVGSSNIRIAGAIGTSTTGAVSVMADQNNVLVNGPVSSGSSVFLLADGNVALAANVSAPQVILRSGGAITQTDTGSMITANSLSASESSGTEVSLPGPNAVDTLAGYTPGTFLFRNDSHPLTIGCVGGPFASCGVLTFGGALTLVTTGTPSSDFDLTVAAPSDIRSNGGAITLMAGGRGGTFTNAGTISTPSSPLAAGDIVILADQMALSGGTITAAAPGHPAGVVLGPVTPTTSVVLGTPAPSGSLNLLQWISPAFRLLRCCKSGIATLMGRRR